MKLVLQNQSESAEENFYTGVFFTLIAYFFSKEGGFALAFTVIVKCL